MDYFENNDPYLNTFMYKSGNPIAVITLSSPAGHLLSQFSSLIRGCFPQVESAFNWCGKS